MSFFIWDSNYYTNMTLYYVHLFYDRFNYPNRDQGLDIKIYQVNIWNRFYRILLKIKLYVIKLYCMLLAYSFYI